MTVGRADPCIRELRLWVEDLETAIDPEQKRQSRQRIEAERSVVAGFVFVKRGRGRPAEEAALFSDRQIPRGGNVEEGAQRRARKAPSLVGIPAQLRAAVEGMFPDPSGRRLHIWRC